jgi:integrase/recombinase XerD
VTDTQGNILTEYFIVRGLTTKSGKDRKMPMHPELKDALISLRKIRPDDENIIYAESGGYMTTNNLTVYMWRLYQRTGFDGASSHSGRRTFITSLSRKHNLHGCSLKDVQLLAGHAHLATTESYVEPSDRAKNLVKAI